MRLIVAPVEDREIRAMNRDLVSRCERQVPVGATNEHIVPESGATLLRQADGIHLRYRYHATVLPTSLSKARVLKLLEDLKSCGSLLNEVWDRYGVKVDYEVRSGSHKRDSRTFVTLKDWPSRSDSANFYSMKSHWAFDQVACFEDCPVDDLECLSNCDQIRKDSFCRTVLHESGHHLQLDDEYPEEDRGKIQTVAFNARPWSVMDTTNESLDEVEFFPRHLRSILPTLCPNVLTENERRLVENANRALEPTSIHKALWWVFPDLIIPAIPET